MNTYEDDFPTRFARAPYTTIATMLYQGGPLVRSTSGKENEPDAVEAAARAEKTVMLLAEAVDACKGTDVPYHLVALDIMTGWIFVMLEVAYLTNPGRLKSLLLSLTKRFPETPIGWSGWVGEP